MLDMPSPLLEETSRDFVDEVGQFAREELGSDGVSARDASGEFWTEGWRRCAARGLCGLPAPKEFGGLGASRVTTAAALEALGRGCDDAGLLFALNAHLWSAVVPLWRFGTAEQKHEYLDPLCRGATVGSHAMTEPASGSDAFSLTTVANPTPGGYVIDGQKTLITNAPAAAALIVFARKEGSEGAFGVTAFLVDAQLAGLTVSRPTPKLGLRTTWMGEVKLNSVRVGKESVLGGEGRGARVFATAMEWERLLIMASQIGALIRSLEETIAYARERRQFGAPIGSFQAVSGKLADAHVGLAAARALMYETAWRYDNGARGPAPAGRSARMRRLLASRRTRRRLLSRILSPRSRRGRRA